MKSPIANSNPDSLGGYMSDLMLCGVRDLSRKCLRRLSAVTQRLTCVFVLGILLTHMGAALALTPTTTTLTTSTNPMTVGYNETMLTVTVAPYTASGTVTIKNGATVLATETLSPNTGVVYFGQNFLTAGALSLTAVYSGNASYSGSTSAVVVQNVNPAPTATAITSYPANVSVGQSVTIAAGVQSITSAGSVTFKDGTATLGTVPVVLSTKTATLTYAYATAGTHSHVAVFNGNADYLPSTSTLVGVTVNAGPSTTVMSSSVNPATVNQSTTLSATVSPSAAAGTVTFKDGVTELGTATLSAGVATLTRSFATAGTHSLTAKYNPPTSGANYTTSTSAALSQTINAATKVPSSVVLGMSPDSGNTSTTVTLSATVTGSSPTGPSGTVSFSDAGVALGSVALNVAGQASMTKVFATAGIHSISASYAGDANNLASVSNTAAVQIASGTTATTPGNMTWLYGHDANDQLWTQIDPLGQSTDIKYDTLNQPTQLTRPPKVGSTAPTVTSTAYDGQGNVVKVTDPRNLNTNYTVNGLGDGTALASPDTGATGYTYDVAGNVLSKTDSRGYKATYTYDALNRIKSASYATASGTPSGTATQLEYDGGAIPPANSKGRLTKITDESGNTSYTYDALGRVLSKTQIATTGTVSKTLTNTYTWGSTGTATGRLTSITYPSGTRVNYSYDTFGRPSAVTLNPVNSNGVGTNTASTVNVLSAIGYTGAGAVKSWTWGNGNGYQRSYDSFGRLSSYPLGNPNGTGTAAGLTRTLSYDAAAQITSYTHSNAAGAQSALNQSFSYDSLGQLLSHTLGTTTYGYSYDATGNRTLRTVGTTPTANTVAATSNRSTKLGVNDLNYDSAGNLAADFAGAYTYATSARGRTSSATIGTSVVSYLYNAMEQRVSKVGPTALVNSTGAAYYAYDEAGQVIGEYDANLAPIL